MEDRIVLSAGGSGAGADFARGSDLCGGFEEEPDGAVPADGAGIPDLGAAGLRWPGPGEGALALEAFDRFGPVGRIKLHPPELSDPLGDLGYWVEPSRRGAGLGRRLLALGLEVLARERPDGPPARVVVAGGNGASLAVARACGGVEEKRPDGSSAFRFVRARP